jgi:hypothetical protein
VAAYQRLLVTAADHNGFNVAGACSANGRRDVWPHRRAELQSSEYSTMKVSAAAARIAQLRHPKCAAAALNVHGGFVATAWPAQRVSHSAEPAPPRAEASTLR